MTFELHSLVWNTPFGRNGLFSAFSRFMMQIRSVWVTFGKKEFYGSRVRYLSSSLNVLKTNLALQYAPCMTHPLAPTVYFPCYSLSSTRHMLWLDVFAIKNCLDWGWNTFLVEKIPWKLFLRFSIPPIKRTVWPLEANFGIFASFFTQVG